MKIKNTAIKEFLFFKSIKLAKSNLNKTGLMVLFDVMFLASLFVLYKLGAYFAQSIGAPRTAASSLIFIIFSLAYYLAVLLAYSFFKYCIMDFIKSLFCKTEFSFKRLGQFYSLNIVIAGIFFAAALLLNMVLAGIKASYQPFVFIFLAVPYLLALYAIINISHSLFYNGASLIEAIKKGFGIAFTKTSSYRETILIMIVIALILWLLLAGSGYLISLFASQNYALYISIYGYFKQAAVIVFDLAFYLAILINRISFYSIIRSMNHAK